jgi:hypothetical protein
MNACGPAHHQYYEAGWSQNGIISNADTTGMYMLSSLNSTTESMTPSRPNNKKCGTEHNSLLSTRITESENGKVST